MKVTREQLRKIIKEELEEAVKEGEVDEALGGFLKGIGKKLGGDVKKKAGQVTQAAGEKVGKVTGAVKQYAGDLKAQGQAASLRQDQNKMLQQMSKIDAQIEQLNQIKQNLQSKLDSMGGDFEATE